VVRLHDEAGLDSMALIYAVLANGCRAFALSARSTLGECFEQCENKSIEYFQTALSLLMSSFLAPDSLAKAKVLSFVHYPTIWS
jgi:hypothetical protein